MLGMDKSETATLAEATSREQDSGLSDQGPRPNNDRQGRLTVARTLKLAAGLVLIAFVAFTFVSFLSVQSIDSSFNRVASVDQPSRDAATDMIAAADAATIAFLESHVSNKRVSSVEAESAFDSSMERYETLVRDTSANDLSGSARELFGQLRQLGRSLVADDQSRQQSFVAVQERLEDMDDTVETGTYLSPLEGDVEESARWVGNYIAAPSPDYREQSLEEIDDLIEEVTAARDDTERASRQATLRTMLSDAREAREVQAQIIRLTERSADTIPRFLSIRSQLDRVLNDRIDESVQASLQRRSAQVEQTVETSKSVLVASLVLGVILGLGALLWVRRRISRPVATLMAAIGGLGEAHASHEADLERNDEFGVLARALTEAATQREALEEELRRQALHDPLTDLANRTLFKERVERALAQRKYDDKRIAVAFLDLDDFKAVNDSLGHAAGDELLVTVAQRVKDSVSTSDTAARLGGDEFAVLLEDVDDVVIPAQRMLDSLTAPIELGGKQISVRGSVGIALHQDGQGATELLRNADVAMYSAKTEGKSRFKIFDETMHSAAVQRFELKNELVAALDNDEFSLHYQPVLDLMTGRRTAVEALLRWESPVRGMVSPGEFIPVAEETNAIVPIGRWVLDTACAQAAAWRRSLDSRDLRLCVNVSPNQLKDSGFVVDVARALASSGLPAGALVLEITENVFLLTDDDVVSALHELAAQGIVIAIDDFGSGYSSLGYLRKLPVGILKIDRSFVNGIDQSPEEGAVAHAIIRLSNALGLEIIAEGIETTGQLTELRRRGCGQGQGFLLGRPSSPETVELPAEVEEAVG
jgi:diguanylate cyclase (GGDEF)-like protein